MESPQFPASPLQADTTAFSPSVEGDALPNPFADDVCSGPFAVEENRSVPGMNADILSSLTTTIDERSGARGGQPLLLLTAPRAGYGKTHLLGRLAAAAGGQVVLVPLAFRLEDSITLTSVAKRGLEAMARAETGRPGWTRLRETCAGVCAVLLEQLIGSGKLPCANADQARRVLAGDPVEIFDPQGAAKLIGDWVRRHGAALRKPMTEQAALRVAATMPVLESWLHALMLHAQEGTASSSMAVRALAAEEAHDGPVTLMQLLGLWRPVVVLVDHLDAYYRNPEAGLKIASLLLDMAEMDGVHVVLSLNQDVWQATFGHHLPSAMEDRLTASQMLLRGIGAAEAAELLRMRLDIADVTPEQAREFEQFVDVRRHFLGRPLGSVSARAFLRHLAQQWDVFERTAPASATPFVSEMITEPAAPTTDIATMPAMHEGEKFVSAVPILEPDPNSIFDSKTTAQARVLAEGLAEPVAALPQENELPLPENEAEQTAEPQPSTGLSERATGAFERLREMLGKLKQTTVPTENGTAAVAESVESVQMSNMLRVAAPLAAVAVAAPAQATLLAPPAPQDVERDALLGRYEALRLQMSAEAEVMPLDFGKLAELIRLAGRRFPLVRFSEYELPGMTGRYVMCWSLQGTEILFGLANFADGAYWRTLSSFAAGKLAELSATAHSMGETPAKLKLVTFKTDREQQSWTILRISDAFPEALSAYLDPVHLDAPSVASLYAMQRIIKESESGALTAEPAQVMSVLARELDFFWKRVTRPA